MRLKRREIVIKVKLKQKVQFTVILTKDEVYQYQRSGIQQGQ